MPPVAFAFHRGLPAVDLDFEPKGSRTTVTRRLLVDSGFIGASAFVLPTVDEPLLVRRRASPGVASGALSGPQPRLWVRCALPALRFRRDFLAIASDLGTLLPPSIDGLAGLTFLQQFAEWGGRRDPAGNWSFVLRM